LRRGHTVLPDENGAVFHSIQPEGHPTACK
jgi:hypothetical protein